MTSLDYSNETTLINLPYQHNYRFQMTVLDASLGWLEYSNIVSIDMKIGELSIDIIHLINELKITN